MPTLLPVEFKPSYCVGQIQQISQQRYVINPISSTQDRVIELTAFGIKYSTRSYSCILDVHHTDGHLQPVVPRQGRQSVCNRV